MRDPLRKVLEFAVARARESEALFKEWAPRVGERETQALLSELAAIERGRTEMLSRMAPAEIACATTEASDLGDLLIDIKAGRTTTLAKAIGLAIRRKVVTAALYDRVGALGGEAGPFFRAMAKEDRTAISDLEAFAERLAAEAQADG